MVVWACPSQHKARGWTMPYGTVMQGTACMSTPLGGRWCCRHWARPPSLSTSEIILPYVSGSLNEDSALSMESVWCSHERLEASSSSPKSSSSQTGSCLHSSVAARSGRTELHAWLPVTHCVGNEVRVVRDDEVGCSGGLPLLPQLRVWLAGAACSKVSPSSGQMPCHRLCWLWWQRAVVKDSQLEVVRGVSTHSLPVPRCAGTALCQLL